MNSEFIYTALTNYPFNTLNWRLCTQNDCLKISWARICCNAAKSVGGHRRLAVCLEQQHCLCAVPDILKVQRVLHKQSLGWKCTKRKT